jgi:hypothetical protein
MSLPFPQSVLEQHVIALGKTGSGKSSKIRVIVEDLLDRKKPVCILDPKGDWWGLKSSADGKQAGYPLVIFGGKHADVPLNPRAGAAVAELIFTGNRPALVDLKGWMPTDRTRFFIDFAGAVFSKTQGIRYFVIDEVHNFAPKGKVLSPAAGEMLHWANRLASEGRGLGLTLIAASQRPQKVHNDFLTSCETLIACRATHKADRVAFSEWIDGCADKDTGAQVLADLAQMKRTDAWVWSPEVEFGPKKVHWPMFQTYDSFQPQAANLATLKGWADVDLEEVRSRLQTVVQEAEANDPVMLKRRIRELEQQLAKPKELAIDAALLEREKQAAEERGRAGARKQFEELRAAAGAVLKQQKIRILRLIDDELPMPELPQWREPAVVIAKIGDRVIGRGIPEDTRISAGNGEGIKLGKAERAILTVLAQHRAGRTKVQIAILAGYSASSSTFENALGALRSAGFATKGGELTQITPAGLEALGSWEPLPSGQALVDHWLGRLGKAERTILAACVDCHPGALTKEELGQVTGYSTDSSTFQNALGKLRTLELVNRGAEIRASEELLA